MPRVLPFLLLLALTVYAVVDCIQSEEHAVRGLPKGIWVMVILVFPLAGSIAWFVAGRPERSGTAPPRQRPSPPRGPDDDPDFLRGL